MPLGIWLLVLSAALHAGWNALLKREENKLASTLAALSVSNLAAVLFSVASGNTDLPRESIPWAVAAGLAEAGYFVCLAHALASASYGLAYTISRGGAMLVVWLLSATLLRERASPATYAGVLLLFGGMVFANMARAAATPDSAHARDRLGPSYLAALFIAGYHLAYGRALAHGAAPAPLFAVALTVALPVVAVCMGRAQTREAWRALTSRPLFLGTAGILATASFVVFLAGLARAGAGVAITVRNTSVVFAQLFALLLGEQVSRRQALGASLIASGAVLVGMS